MLVFKPLTETAENPAPLMTPAQPEFFPVLISVRPVMAVLYSHGFRKPSAALPVAIRLLFKSCITLAKVGVAALVPETSSLDPDATITKLVDCAATSGYARPELLKYWATPACVLSFASQLLTAGS